MSAWVQVAFAVGGVVAGFPVTAAMAELPNRSGAGVSLAVARDHARAATVPRPRRRRAPVRTTNQGDPWEELLLWGVGVVVAVALYAVSAVAIAVTMFWVAVATLLHVDDIAREHALSIIPSMAPSTLRLLDELDLALRVRNPGVHYVRRSTFLGYRREGATGSSVGARSQIFLSVVPKRGLLQLVFVPPAPMPLPPQVEDIGERGHQGVGTHRCVVRTSDEQQAFMADFDTLIRP